MIILSTPTLLLGQSPADTSVYDPIRVIYTDKQVTVNDPDDPKQYYIGNVKIVHDSTYFLCDSAVTSDQTLKAFNHVTILKADTIETHSNSLIYNGQSKSATLNGDVSLVNGNEKLFTNTLYLDLMTDVATYQDTALMTSQTAQLSSIKGRYDLNKKVAYFFEDVIVIDSSFTLLTDTLHYDVESNVAVFFGPSYISQEETQIYAEGGYYNTETGDAFFEQNAKYNSATGRATSDLMRYSSSDKNIILEGNAIVRDTSYTAMADRIEYLQADSIVILVGNASVINDESQAIGDYIKLNQATGQVEIFGSGTYNNGNTSLASDTIYYNEKTEIGNTIGSSVYTDETEQRRLFSDHLTYNEDGSYLAYNTSGRPYLEQVSESGDTTYLSADTLYSYTDRRDTLTLDSVDYFIGYPDVIVYSQNFQAVADSLSYSLQDSTLQLFGTPIAWADTTQFAGDTIIMINDSVGISDVHLYGKANLISYIDDKYQDQIKGKTIHAKLDNQSLESLHVVGNAETIYLLRDEEGRYIAANKTICSYIDFWFEDGELSDIKFHGEPVSHMNPIDQASGEDLYLSKIKWDVTRRPLSKNDLFHPVGKATLGKDDKDNPTQSESLLEIGVEDDKFEQEIKDALKKQNNKKND